MTVAATHPMHDKKKRVNPYKHSSHEGFDHDSLESFGYDWERIGNPYLRPKFPLKLYLPQTTDDVITIVREVGELGQELKIRSKGHSSNDLVLAEGSSTMTTQMMNKVLAVDEDAMTVTVQGGAVLADIDDHLWPLGLGLKIIGDHNHITAGGFGAVGGISPASHRFGLFIDTVTAMQVVTWDGELVECTPTTNPELFYSSLAGLGKTGVMVTLTLSITHVDKYRHILQNDRYMTTKMDKFIEKSKAYIRDPDQVYMERGLWVEIGSKLKVGQFSPYHEVAQSGWKSWRNKFGYGKLHTFGKFAGRLPRPLEVGNKFLGMIGIIFSPKYASIKNVETFTDMVLDSSIGDPTRMFIILAPIDKYENLFRGTRAILAKYRDEQGVFPFISIYVKAIRSPYLAKATGLPEDQSFCELMPYVGVDPDRLTPELLEQITSEVDDMVIREGGLRYMHSKTVKDDERRNKFDPNVLFRKRMNYTVDLRDPAAAGVS